MADHSSATSAGAQLDGRADTIAARHLQVGQISVGLGVEGAVRVVRVARYQRPPLGVQHPAVTDRAVAAEGHGRYASR